MIDQIVPEQVDAYVVVGEMREYFDGHRLATWAPLASIIERERLAAFNAGLERAAGICEHHCTIIGAAPYSSIHSALTGSADAIRAAKEPGK